MPSSRHPTATRVNLPWFLLGVHTLTLHFSFASSSLATLTLNTISFSGRVSWLGSERHREVHTHTKKQSLGPELPITAIAFDGISDDDDDDEQATVSQNLMRSTHPDDDRHGVTKCTII